MPEQQGITGSASQAEALLASNVRYYRKALGFSLRELGDKSGVPFSIISRVERGHPCLVKTGEQIATGLGMELWHLLQEHTRPETGQ